MDSNDFAAAVKNSTTISIVVKPNNSKNDILGYSIEKKAWMIAVKAAAEKDAANKELLRFVKRATGKQFLIKSGLRSRETQVADATGPSRPLSTWETLVSTSSYPSSRRIPQGR